MNETTEATKTPNRGFFATCPRCGHRFEVTDETCFEYDDGYCPSCSSTGIRIHCPNCKYDEDI